MTTSTQTPPTPTPSPLFGIRPTPTKGRSAHTLHPLPSRTAILHAKPYALSPLPSYRKRLCAYLPCSLSTPTYFTISCNGCQAVYYCSERCRRRNRAKHVWVCGGMRRLRGWARDRHVAGVVGLVLEVLAQARVDGGVGAPCSNSEDEDKENDGDDGEEEEDMREDQLREQAYSALLRSSSPAAGQPPPPPATLQNPTFAQVLSLQSHLPSWTPSDLRDWTLHTNFILSLFSHPCCLPGLLPRGWGIRQILDLASKVECNAFGLFEGEDNALHGLLSPERKGEGGPYSGSGAPYGEVGKGEAGGGGGEEEVKVNGTVVGRTGRGKRNGGGGGGGACFARGIYPQASFFNHSCVPNAQADALTSLEVFRLPLALPQEDEKEKKEETEEDGNKDGNKDGKQDGKEVEKKVGKEDGKKEEEAIPLDLVHTIGLGRILIFSLALPDGEVLPPGEEITISYISVDLPRPTRRALLASEYHFDCLCERCEDEDRGKRKAGKTRTRKVKIPPKKEKKKK